MSSHASIDGRHKKILRTKVKVWGKYRLNSEAFDISKAEQLIHKALDNKASVQTIFKLYGDGVRIGEKGVLAALHAEFVLYPNITAIISLRELPNILVLANKELGGQASHVTVIQFKDIDALQISCDIIDRQRGVLNKSNSSTPSKPAALAPAPVVQAAKPAAQPVTTAVTAIGTAPTVAVAASDTVETAVRVKAALAPQPKPEIQQPTSPPVEVEVTATNLFEKRPFTGEITQPPTTEVLVHTSTSTESAPTATAEEDDENHFRTSIVFGDDVRLSSMEETMERQKRMEALLQMRANRNLNAELKVRPSVRLSDNWIAAEVLNYDEIDVDGTHAVFDTPDGPPIQLNERTENLRRRPNELLVKANSSQSSAGYGSSRLVVTSFSANKSDSPMDSQTSTYLHGAAPMESEPIYRTSTVIYRDAPDPEYVSVEGPRVTYVTNQRNSSLGGVAVAAQPMQLVRLVPLSSPRHHPQQQQHRYTASQHTENGVYLVAK